MCEKANAAGPRGGGERGLTHRAGLWSPTVAQWPAAPQKGLMLWEHDLFPREPEHILPRRPPGSGLLFAHMTHWFVT